eukprot:Seg1585.11 transcript_id=Seg1585.11/GoldUCD/mRNA.D3Y31 product="hypothetical protein" protein_id=Seg1585.11/GoldUCD/D3Y31
MIEPRKMVRFGFGTSRQREERSSPSSHLLSRPESRSSTSDRSITRDAAPFSSFRQRWVSDNTKSESSRKASKNGLSSSGLFETRGDRKLSTSSSDSSSKHEILGRSSPLTKLKEFHFARESRSSGKSNRAGSGVGSRSNLALAERLAGTSFGRSQPLFEHRKTFQTHESRQEGATSQAGERSEPVSRSRSGSLPGEYIFRSRSSSLSSLSENTGGLLQEDGLGSERHPRFTGREGSGADRKIFRYQKTEQSARKEGNLRGTDATVSLHAIEERLTRHKQRLAEKMAKANKGRESPAAARKQCDTSSILQRILNDRSRPFHNKQESTFTSRSDGAMIFKQERKFESESLTRVSDGSVSSIDSMDSQETVIPQERIIGDKTYIKKDTTTMAKAWGKQNSREERHIDEQSAKVSGLRHIGAVAQAIVSERKLLRDGIKGSAEGQSSRKPSTVTGRTFEKVETNQEDVGDPNSKTGAQSSDRRRFENFVSRNIIVGAQSKGQSPRKPSTVTGRTSEKEETKKEDVGDPSSKTGAQRRFENFVNRNMIAGAQSVGQSPRKPSTVTRRIIENIVTKQEDVVNSNSKAGTQSSVRRRFEDFDDSNITSGAQSEGQSPRKPSTVTRKIFEKVETKQEDVVDSNSKAGTQSFVRRRFEDFDDSNITSGAQSEGQSPRKPSTVTRRIIEKVETKQEDVVDSNSKAGTQSFVRRRFEDFDDSNITSGAQSEGQSPRKPSTVTRRIIEKVETKQEDVVDSNSKAGTQSSVRRRFEDFDDSNITSGAQSEGQLPRKPSTVTRKIFEKIETKRDTVADLNSKAVTQSQAAQSKGPSSGKPSTGWRRITEKLESKQEDIADSNSKTGAQSNVRKILESSSTAQAAQSKVQSLRKPSTAAKPIAEQVEPKQREDVVDSNSKSGTHSNVRQRFENDNIPETAQPEGQSLRNTGTVTRKIAEKLETKQEDEVDSNSNTGAQSNVRQRFECSNLTEAARSDIDKKGVVSSHIDLDSVVKINQAIANEVKEKKKSVGAQEFKIRKTNAMGIPPSVSPKPGPRTSPKPSPKPEIVLSGKERIKIGVQLPEDNTQGDNEVFQDSESPGCSIEVPQPTSVANLRLSLFGGDKSSMEKLISRGMGGVLAKIPVKLRTQQVTSERRQVMSSVEVSSNGVETLSTTRVSMRMTTKSESEAESENPETLPSLFRFEKPKKQKITTPSRNLRRVNEPVTVQLELSPDVTISTRK